MEKRNCTDRRTKPSRCACRKWWPGIVRLRLHLRLKLDRIYELSSLSATLQVDHCLQMEGLRKQVSESHGLNRVSRIDQHTQVTRERCWIAGNVDQSRRCNVDKLRSDLSTQSTSWWIDNNQVRSSSPVLRSEKRKCFRLHGFTCCSVQILFECCRRRGCRLDRNYTLKVCSKSP